MSNEAEGMPDGNHESDEPGPVLAGYYRAWHDNCGKPKRGSISLGDVPADLDLVSIITNGEVDDDFWVALPAYIEKLHAQGTKVVRTLFLDCLYQDAYEDCGKVHTFARLGAENGGPDRRADEIIANYLEPFDYDGLVIDVDHEPESEQMAAVAEVFHALAKKWGPGSASSRLMIFDQDILLPQTSLIAQVFHDCSYYFADTYGMDVRRIQGLFEQVRDFVPASKFVTGFSFYEEGGPRWGDVTYPIEGSRVKDLLSWHPFDSNRTGGLFAYAIDRDGVAQGDDRLRRTDFKTMHYLKEELENKGVSHE